MFLNCTGK